MIDVAPLPRPDWADPEVQLPDLRRDMGFDPGERDDEIRQKYAAAIHRLGGRNGGLSRPLVPSVERHSLPSHLSSMRLPRRPVIAIVGFERKVDGAWSAIEGVRYSLDGDSLEWTVSAAGPDVRVVYHAGYLDGDPDLNVIVAALRLIARQLIDGHSDSRQRSINMLLENLQVYG